MQLRPLLDRNGIWLLTLSLLMLAVRIKFAGLHAESWDAVDFALALERYDILEMQPHFPGYPIYIIAAHGLLPFTKDPVLALTWLSALCGSLSLFPFYLLAKRILPDRISVWFALLLFAASPLLALTHVQPMSDALGLFFALTLQAALAGTMHNGGRRLLLGACIAALLYAVLLGIRISYFPVGFLLLYPLLKLYRQRESMRRFLLHVSLISFLFLAAVAAWLLPTAATEGGLIPFLQLGQAFTIGHFSDWGGTSFSAATSWWERAFTLLGQRLFLNGLLGVEDFAFFAPLPGWSAYLLAWLLAAMLLVALFSLLKRSGNVSPLLWFILLSVLPYALWAFLGQNSEKARHILPLLPWLLMLLAYGLSMCLHALQRQARKWAVAAAFLLLLLPLTARQLHVVGQHQQPPPALQMIRYVQQHYPAEATYVYTWEEQRLFDYYAADYRSERLRSFSYFTQSVLLHAGSTPHLLVTNAVLDGFGDGHMHRSHVREAARFSADPLLYPAYHTVILYEIPQETVERLRNLPVSTSGGELHVHKTKERQRRPVG